MANESTANPILISLLFIMRCMVPLLLMLGISILLKRFRLIAEPPSPPNAISERETTDDSVDEGGMAHDSA